MEGEEMALGLLTDAELRAREVLSQSSIHVLREIEVELDGSAIRLEGCVDSFYHKQLAQELVKNVLEGVEVVNALKVDYHRQHVSTSRNRK